MFDRDETLAAMRGGLSASAASRLASAADPALQRQGEGAETGKQIGGRGRSPTTSRTRRDQRCFAILGSLEEGAGGSPTAIPLSATVTGSGSQRVSAPSRRRSQAARGAAPAQIP